MYFNLFDTGLVAILNETGLMMNQSQRGKKPYIYNYIHIVAHV